MSHTDETMSCEDYKNSLMADPGFEDETGHVQNCASCQAFRNDQQAFDRKIAAAMEISVPALQIPELPDMAETQADNVVTLSRRPPLSKPAWFALAATVLLAVFVGIRMTTPDANALSLAQQVLAHVDHEPGALSPTNTAVSAERLRRTVPHELATMNNDSGLITYAQSCIINGKTVPHLVLQGERGPITILLMPHEKVSDASTFDGVGTHGVILPVGDGSIAIVGDREENLDHVKQSVLDSVTWST